MTPRQTPIVLPLLLALVHVGALPAQGTSRAVAALSAELQRLEACAANREGIAAPPCRAVFRTPVTPHLKHAAIGTHPGHGNAPAATPRAPHRPFTGRFTPPALTDGLYIRGPDTNTRTFTPMDEPATRQDASFTKC